LDPSLYAKWEAQGAPALLLLTKTVSKINYGIPAP
jgi:hypothetical protein